jgi:predicted CopG family antitoxin
MAHKTITISEEAYEALAGMKAAKESFTDVILKIVKKKEEGTLLDYVRSIEPDQEFAKILEHVVKERSKISLSAPAF